MKGVLRPWGGMPIGACLQRKGMAAPQDGGQEGRGGAGSRRSFGALPLPSVGPPPACCRVPILVAGVTRCCADGWTGAAHPAHRRTGGSNKEDEGRGKEGKKT